jgi:hypothetical protein
VLELDGSGDTLLLKATNLTAEGASDGAAASGGGAGGSSGDGEEGEEGPMGAGGPSENTMLMMLEAAWRMSLLDIEGTLRHACNKGTPPPPPLPPQPRPPPLPPPLHCLCTATASATTPPCMLRAP